MRTHDLLGIGLGPFGLSLAALADGVNDLDAVFLDQRPGLSWHPGLLLEGATLQVPFLADLVTLVDPTSRWSYLAYLKTRGRLFRFYLAERFQVPRSEYDDYLRWVAESLPSCRFGQRVDALAWDGDAFVATVTDTTTRDRRTLRARSVVLGVGTEPVVPAPFEDLLGKRVVHAAQYLDARPALHEAASVTVVGSGQSGAEVFLDLLRAQPETGTSLRWLTRTPAFAPMEYSKLGLEHFTPDYTGYFHGLPQPTRDALLPAQWQLYKGISTTTIAEIYDLLYERTVGGRRVDAVLQPAVAVEAARSEGDGYVLECRQVQQDRTFSVPTGGVVLATGHAARRPALLDPLLPVLDLDEQGRYRIGADHRVALRCSGALYVQNAETHTHGVGAPDLGLGAWRSATILGAITGRPLVEEPQQGAFTTFGAP
ncbi:lysine N(6)-hydroxylase/L-ornithine N(5)-oxygenase family protein [Blastococcus capsensis]|uniref:lysine N(6)-hydroxylase/L-ornithine N(5)-oxygenase family protein n=1 Tax=Blastococcus capsensis TaxID=1564163 RepID=UPI002540D818|nr:SidA/IucD/PvdA family monooxygenase [Blastococcus capsensis]MDK3256672.1 SidA/IucD/PvdA family monooxygenase [Blastococcus capsensis]